MRYYVVGAGGFAREVLDVLEALQDAGQEVDVGGFVADGGGDAEELERRGYSLLGGIDALPAAEAGSRYVIGIGTGAVRAAIAARLDAQGWTAASLIHPTATFGARVTVGPGVVVCAGVRVTTEVVLGEHVHLNLNTTVGHDTTLGAFTTVNPLVSISGRVWCDEGVTIGTGATILERRRLGRVSLVERGWWAMVSACHATGF